jgi:hypothetical protein
MQKVQSIIIKKDNYDLEKACNWIVNNHFQLKKIDETTNTFRFRQFSPQALRKEGYNNYKTLKLNPDIDLVVAFKAV